MICSMQTFKKFVDEMVSKYSVAIEHRHRLELYCQRDCEFPFDSERFWGHAHYILEYLDDTHQVKTISERVVAI